MRSRISWKRCALVSIGWVCLTTGFAQQREPIVSLHFQDKHTGKKIPNILVQVQSTNQQVASGITDQNGVVHFRGLTLPLQMEAQHLGYEDTSLTIKEEGIQTIHMFSRSIALDPVVVTGQHAPQSINQSVFTVKSIDKKQIDAQGAVDLGEVLTNALNISLSPNKSSGKTSVSMMGLDGQYVKILIDGIPFAGVEGNGNNVDITQINLSTIERIEIVEGPMAVSYGANAVAGVINLITKKSSHKTITIQEESAGKEYGWKKGRHIQKLSAGHKIRDNVLLQLDFQRNDGRGFQGIYKGPHHIEEDEKRGFDWHPKLQHLGSLGLHLDGNKINAMYKYGYFHQQLDRFSRVVFRNEHPATGLIDPFALDEDFVTRRFLHQLNLSGNLGRIRYKILSGFTGEDFTRTQLNRRILIDREEVIQKDNSFLHSLTSRGHFTNILPIESPGLSLELGYEYTHEQLKSASIARGEQAINNLAGFASVEWTLMDRFTLRPGVRTFYNSRFRSPLIYSLNLKYQAVGNTDIRVSFGRAYRTPNLTELFYYFVDANHDLRGNENLVPEDGYGASLDLRKRFGLGSGYSTMTMKAFYNDLSDQITLAVVNDLPLQFQYINVDRFRSKGITWTNRISFSNLSLNAGLSYIGRYNRFNEEHNSLSKFLYSPEVNFNSTYRLESYRLRLGIFYKHTGKVEQYVFDNELSDFRKGTTQAFNWLDFTTTWDATKNLQLSAGIKNLLNIVNVQTTTGTAGVRSGAHSDAPTSVGLAYGRSYFFRVGYTF